ncbi:MAG TPA: hypothetical protein VNI54_01795 [Thermoanaerobaculia bacterium]|nr:hypothetical protein [Thermoanaerobaculia bacterium]
MRTLTLAVLLACATALLAASTPETAISGTDIVAAPHGRWYASAASNGQDFFTVWTDYRAGEFESVVGTRITAAGEVLDLTNLILGVGGTIERPQVVWDGGAYVVVWTQIGYDSATGRKPARLWMTRVSADGRIVSPARVIQDAATSGKSDFLASNGNVTVVAYLSEDPRTMSDVKALVLDRHGNVLYDQTLPTTNGPREDVNVATSGSDFVFAWTTYIGGEPYIEAASLDGNGEYLATSARIVGDGISSAIASNGSQYVIVARRVIGEPAWISRVVTAELASVSPTCQVAAGTTGLEDANVVFRNGQYDFIAWRPDPTPYDALVTTRVDLAGCATGGLRDLSTITVEVAYAMPAVATNGRSVIAVWTHSRAGEGRYDIAARIYSGTSQLGPATLPLLLSRSANTQRKVQIAHGNGETMAAWIEADGSVWAGRVGTGGRGIRLSTTAWDSVRTTFDGSNFVVAWSDGIEIFVRWIDPVNETVVRAHDINENNPGDLALATIAEATYVAWIDDFSRVRLARIGNGVAGVVSVTPQDDEVVLANPALSSNGSALLVGWTENFHPFFDPPISVPAKVWAARVTPQLTILDTAPLLVGDEPDIDAGPPAIASDGNDWLVVWDGDGLGVRARRVFRDGRLDGDAPTLLVKGFAPGIAFDGVRYAVAWQDLYGGGSDYRQRALRLGVIPATGSLGVSFGTSIAALDAWPAPASVARAGDGRVVVAYGRVSFGPEHGGVERGFLRFFDTSIARKSRATR